MATYSQTFPDNSSGIYDFVPITVAGAVADFHRIPIAPIIFNYLIVSIAYLLSS